MTEIVVLAIVLVIIVIFFRMRKKSHKSPAPAIFEKANKPQTDTKPKNGPVAQAKPAQPVSKPAARPKTAETVTLSSTENLPQDSMLRRHYLANLRAMVESLNPPRPTDSSLSRHYDSLIVSEIEQCSNDKGAVERLICKYENHKKSLAQPIQQSKKPAEPSIKSEVIVEKPAVQIESPKLPEDSALRRHTITHLKALAEANK